MGAALAGRKVSDATKEIQRGLMTESLKPTILFGTVFAIIAMFLSGCHVIDKTEFHGEPRIFTHPETGMEYYYEVPEGNLYVHNMNSFCQNLDFEGGGWYWATINDLRSLVIGCPILEPGGSCKVTNDCRSEDYCYSRGSCDCEAEETENDNDTLKTISILHRSDNEKIVSRIYSSTCNSCYEGEDYIEYWTINFDLNGGIDPDYSSGQPPSSDIICVRSK
jgi:hypothetical protein